MYQRLVESLREEKIMNSRERFLDELEQELSNISKTERDEALQYYREYFEDANMSDEEVIRQLGSVTSVADSIRENLLDRDDSFYQSDKEEDLGTKYTSKMDEGYRTLEETVTSAGKTETDTSKIVLIVLAVLFSPFLLGIAGSVLGFVISLIATVFAFVISIAACAIAFAVAAVTTLLVAITHFMADPLLAVLLLGACMFFTGLCFLFTLATIKLFTFVIPGLVKGIGNLGKSIFKKPKKEMA